MPRLSALRTRALAELARQLRFESADAARRQLGRAEQLAVELLEGAAEKDAAPAFPEEEGEISLVPPPPVLPQATLAPVRPSGSTGGWTKAEKTVR